MKTFDMTWEQVDAIVINELKDSIDMQFKMAEINDEVDWRLIDALKIVLAYYMPMNEYQEYTRELALTELAVETQRLGLYDDEN